MLRAECLATTLWFMLTCEVFAQEAGQVFELREGWNAVYFELDPGTEEADHLFANLPIQAVWTRSEGRDRSVFAFSEIEAPAVSTASSPRSRESRQGYLPKREIRHTGVSRPWWLCSEIWPSTTT